MDKLAKIVVRKDVRFLESKKEAGKKIPVIDLVISTGLDDFLVTAFDTVASRIIAEDLNVGAICLFSLNFSVSGNQEDKYKFQSIRLTNYAKV